MVWRVFKCFKKFGIKGFTVFKERKKYIYMSRCC